MAPAPDSIIAAATAAAEYVVLTSTSVPSSRPALHHPSPPDSLSARNTSASAMALSPPDDAGLASQKPLPSLPLPRGIALDAQSPDRPPPRPSAGSDPAVHDADRPSAADGGPVSEPESANGDSRGLKKKKSQRFFCLDFPPCKLSFTRSEHLARHIRKHTGERPFTCHCNRRFSRLDNLRQHAQTVHLNEDIPSDSPAATGARFPRPRPDRPRPIPRVRIAAGLGPSRGHAKSLSASSIPVIGSGYGVPADDQRPRPAPILVTFPPQDGTFYRPASPSDMSTPTSATFSTGQNSPHWGSGVVSPTSSHSRSQSLLTAGTRTPGRRLSVPSVPGNPFHFPQGTTTARHFLRGSAVGSPGPVFPAPGSSILVPPPAQGAPAPFSRRDSTASATDDWRRRTWHPDSNNFAASNRVANVSTPPRFTPPSLPPVPPQHFKPGQITLPGIESFDRPCSGSPPARQGSPMMITTYEPPRMSALLPAAPILDDRKPVTSWADPNLSDMDRPERTPRPRTSTAAMHADAPASWAPEAAPLPQQPAPAGPTVRFDARTEEISGQLGGPVAADRQSPPQHVPRHQHTLSAPAPLYQTPRHAKRRGWYHGPPAGITSGRGAASGSSRGVDRIIHPNLANGFSGFSLRETPVEENTPAAPSSGPVDPSRDAEPHQHGYLLPQPLALRYTEQHYQQEQFQHPLSQQAHPSPAPPQPHATARFDALVAVATSEGSRSAAAAY